MIPQLLRALVLGVTAGAAALAQSPDQIRAAVGQLGDFDFAVRLEASRLLRRAPPGITVPELLQAARGHEDTYVQFRAAVLLYGFGDAQASGFFQEALDLSNDRVRAAAYGYFEHAPDPKLVPKLLAALDLEVSEFARPALVRALAAHDADVAVQARLVSDIARGEGYFRGAVIEALGDFTAAYAVAALIPIATEPGPLQDDALLALGKIGDERALATLATVQLAASPPLQPIVSATRCLLDIDCADHLSYVIEALEGSAQVAPGERQQILRNAATGLAALAMRGQRDALDALVDAGILAGDRGRAPIALALGTVALRNPAVVIGMLSERKDLKPTLLLLRDAFDMLDEDLAEERFYVQIRDRDRTSAVASRDQEIAEQLIQFLEF